MNTQLIKHPDFGEIRTQVIKGEPWFCAVDICDVLGYTNSRKAINDHCRAGGVTKRYGVSLTTNQYGKTTEQATETNFINEGNLYRLILKSNMPKAEKFEGWVCDEVLPSIRKNGFYVHPAFLDAKAVKLLERQRDKEEAAAFRRLSSEMKKHLTDTDKGLAAKKLGISEYAVGSVLDGTRKDVTVMREMFERAMMNSRHVSLYYTRQGSEAAIGMLRGEKHHELINQQNV